VTALNYFLLLSSDSIRCPPPSPIPRRRRRNEDEAAPLDADPLDGAPSFARPDDEPRATRIPRECKSAAQFVELLFPPALIDQLVLHTNAAATQHPRLCTQQRYSQWHAVTRAEMTLFLAISVYLGVVKVQNRKLIWRHGGIFEQKWVTQRMSLRRFECILNAFNCCNYWTLSDAEYTAKNATNPFWQIEHLVSVCNERCALHFKMGRAFSIDEAVIPWKGKHRARCYNPKKPAKYHFKKFSLNCASTGFVYCHYHYGGKDEQRPAGVPASVWPIKKLVDQCEALHGKSHLCATDNWYTCAQSLSYLRRRGIHSLGTIKKGRLCPATATRRGFPQAGIFKPARGQPKRARADCMIHSTVVEGHDAFVTSWQDKKAVLLLSSYRPSGGVCERKIKVGRTWTRQQFFRPNVIAHYNRTMGGTDLHDQRLALARSTIKSRRWQPRVLIDLFSSMLLNAFVLFKLHDKANHKILRARYNSFDFIADWLEEIAGDAERSSEQSSDVDDAPQLPYKAHRRKWWNSDVGKAVRMDHRYHGLEDARNVYQKSTVKVGSDGDEVEVRLDLRRKCLFCGERNCYTFCSTCNVPLCLGECCRKFHCVATLPALKA